MVHRPATGSTTRRDLTSSGIQFTFTELRVRSCESGPNGYATGGRALDYDYSNENPKSTASGGWQVIDGTWGGFGGYHHASSAPRSVQDRWARRYIDKNGLGAWISSKSCWGS